MKIPLVDLKAQYELIKDEIAVSFERVLNSTQFIRGEEAAKFEDNFARFCNTSYALGVGNGTDALYIALRTLNVGFGDEVITATNTFIATAEAIGMTGAKPVFVDCDPQTYNMDVNKIESALSEKTKAIIPVHLYGQPADMNQIMEIAVKYNLWVVEDSAQAHGAEYKGNRAGSIGHIGCFSFYPGKNLGAYGDAGAIVTNNEKFYFRAKMLSNHGRTKKYIHDFEGLNSRLDGLQAAVLNVKMKYIQEWTEKRIEKAKNYCELLSNIENIILPKVMPQIKHVYHLFVIQINNRDEVLDEMKNRGIGAGIHYPVPLHQQPAYAHLGYKKGDFPNAELLSSRALSLPLYPEITFDQQEFVVNTLKQLIV